MKTLKTLMFVSAKGSGVHLTEMAVLNASRLIAEEIPVIRGMIADVNNMRPMETL
jgi:hypothetical protein